MPCPYWVKGNGENEERGRGYAKHLGLLLCAAWGAGLPAGRQAEAYATERQLVFSSTGIPACAPSSFMRGVTKPENQRTRSLILHV